jgi:hypothetical protein
MGGAFTGIIAMWDIGDRKENIIHCQMRNDASNLNLHLQQHHLSDRPSCPHCNDPCESPSHYCMHCWEYCNRLKCLKKIKFILLYYYQIVCSA